MAGKLYINEGRYLMLWVMENDAQQVSSVDGRWIDVEDGLHDPSDGGWTEVELPAKPFVPLDVPEVGRKIKATLRSGRVETGRVRKTGGEPACHYVMFEETDREGMYIVDENQVVSRMYRDILAWEYVKEFTVEHHDVYDSEGNYVATFANEADANDYVEAKNNA